MAALEPGDAEPDGAARTRRTPPDDTPPDGTPPEMTPPTVPAAFRVVLYLLFIVILIGLGMGAVLPVVAPEALDSIEDGGSVDLGLSDALLVQAMILPLVLLGTAFFVRRVDRRRLTWIGLNWSPAVLRLTVAAAAVAALAPILWLAMVAVAAEARFGGLDAAAAATGPLLRFAKPALYFLGFSVAALAEEIMLRGYVFTVLAERYRFVNAAGASGVVFALLHWGNPEVGPVALINTFLLGLLFAAIRYKSGSILPAVAAHAIWNTLIGCVLSLPLSGIRAEPLLDLTIDGNVHATGGSYGPEASLLLTGILVPLVFLAVLWAEEMEVGEDEAAG